MQYLMVDTFPKTFSQAATSRWYFPKRQLPVGIFPSGNFPLVFSQVEPFQLCNFPSGNFPSLFFSQQSAPQFFSSHSSQCSQRRSKWPNLTFRKFPLRKLHIWEVATWEIGTWEVAFWKFPLGKLLKPLFLFTLIFSKIYNKF